MRLHLGCWSWQDLLQPAGRRGLAPFNALGCQPESLWDVHLALPRRWQPLAQAKFTTQHLRWLLCCLVEVTYKSLEARPQATQDELN